MMEQLGVVHAPGQSEEASPHLAAEVGPIHRTSQKKWDSANFACYAFSDEVCLPHARRLLLGWRTPARPEHIP
jgi:hypothetical protein